MNTRNNQTDSQFDFGEFEKRAIENLRAGADLSNVLAPLIKSIIEKSLEGELEHHLNYVKHSRSHSNNSRNGKSKKNLKTNYGTIELETPRDRKGSFDPQLVKKRQTTLGDSLDNKIISLYSMGMSCKDISSHIKELYGTDVSPALISNITDKVLPKIKEWQARTLESVYTIVWMDALFFKVKENGKIVSKALYLILGINQKGYKDVLSFFINESEGANFWLSVLTDLSNRGVKDILIACIDNLKGFSEAIESIFPKTEVQLCVIHQIRNSLKYIATKDQRSFLKDLKLVYKATTKELAEQKLLELEQAWGDKYPIVIKSWKSNWDRLSQFFKYPEYIRKLIYTTNMIENLNRQIRKVTKTKGSFPSDDAVFKLVHLVLQNITKKWTIPLPNWSLVISQFSIIFEGRINLDLKT